MKKLFVLTVLLMAYFISFSQKGKGAIEGKGLYFGLSYSKSTRTEFDKYMTVISDSLKLTNPLVAKNGYGLNLGFIIRNNKGEFEAGGSYVFGTAAKSNNSNNSTTASLSTNTFDIHFGYSVYIAGPLFIGLDLGAISNDGKITITGGNASLFEPTPESHNPFKGYVFFARPKGGFFFPFKKDKVSGFKLSAFYDMSISKYDFYNKDIFSMRLKNYKGDTKTSFKGLGIQASLVLALD
jgi:hypothetical protein